MNEDLLTEFIIKELGKSRRMSDIIMDVCERSGMRWKEGQKFVYDVAYQQRRGVSARRSPLVMAVGIAIIVFGLFVSVAMASALYNRISFTVNGVPFLGNKLGLGFGLLLIAGGLIAIWKRAKNILE